MYPLYKTKYSHRVYYSGKVIFNILGMSLDLIFFIAMNHERGTTLLEVQIADAFGR